MLLEVLCYEVIQRQSHGLDWTGLDWTGLMIVKIVASSFITVNLTYTNIYPRNDSRRHRSLFILVTLRP